MVVDHKKCECDCCSKQEDFITRRADVWTMYVELLKSYATVRFFRPRHDWWMIECCNFDAKSAHNKLIIGEASDTPEGAVLLAYERHTS